MAAETDPGDDSQTSQDLRHRRAEVSRQAIRDAVLALLREEHPANLSIPAVAARAGVSVRTIYRYFPTKQDLLDDVAQIQQRRADQVLDGRQDMFERPDQYLTALWTGFATEVEAIRDQHISPLGADLRAMRMEAMRSEVQVRLEKAFPEADANERRDLGDLIMLVTSSSAFLELHDRMGHSAADASRLAWWAVEAMQRSFGAAGGFSRPASSTAPPSDDQEQRSS